MALFTLALYMVLMPDLLFPHIPAKGSKFTVALVHGLLFALIFHFTHKQVWNYYYGAVRSSSTTASFGEEKLQNIGLLAQNIQQGISPSRNDNTNYI